MAIFSSCVRNGNFWDSFEFEYCPKYAMIKGFKIWIYGDCFELISIEMHHLYSRFPLGN